jgi:hemerythrin-like domain-containing protein
MEALDKIAEQAQNLYNSLPRDVVSAIKKDHKSLRNYLDILKDTDAKMSERRKAYAEFSVLLKSHSEAEEQIVYKETFKLTGKKLHVKVAEGFVEHQLATDIMGRLEKSKTALEWSAHANVLSEIVEHHLDEEERDLLPLVRKKSTAKLDQKMLTEFIAMRAKTQKKTSKKNAGVLK